MPPRTRRSDLVAQLQPLIAAQAATRDQQSKVAQAGVRRAFSRINDWTDPAQTGPAVTAAVTVVQAAQRRVASVTDGYLARSTTTITGRRADTVGAVDVRSLRRKLPQDVIEQLAAGRSISQAVAERAQARVEAVPAEEVYGRIPQHVRFAQVARGMNADQAAVDGIRRAMAMADTDVMMADRAQAQRFFSTRKPSGVIGYRRILHPELGSGAPPCGLCVVAADRVYRIEELMPIHSRCRCTVAAVTQASDPGLQLNGDDLARVYQAAGGNTARRLKTVRVEFAEHGELGPVIVNADQHFRGPDEFARTQSQDLEKRWYAELEGLQENLDSLLGRAGESAAIDESIRWTRYKMRELSARLPS